MTRLTMIVIVAVILLACAGLIAKYAWDNRDGECIRGKPPTITGGRIFSDGGPFSGKPEAYFLVYAGTYEHSGEKCKDWARVTEAKYSREMYADE